jgi:hypothetical protein
MPLLAGTWSMNKNETGTILLIFVGMLSVFISCFICAVNIYSVVSQQQYLRNVVDQASLVGTNQIDLDSYYKFGISRDIALDNSKVQESITNFIESNYDKSEIIGIKIETFDSNVSIFVEKKCNLPIGIGLNFVKISAMASAKLQVL